MQPDYAFYSTGDALVRDEPRADIAFLDVEMPGVSGIQAGAKLKEKNPRVKIFIVTAYPDYLDEAMRFLYSIGKDTVVLRCADRTIEVYLSRRKYTQFRDTCLMYLESTK